MMVNLGEKSNLDVIHERIPLHGKTVADIGCGSLGFTREISSHCQQVFAIDPSPEVAEQIRRQDDLGNIEFHHAGAEQIPLADSSVDGIFFCHSLHHISAQLYPRAFAEVQRVLRARGFLYVIEPTDFPLNEVMSLFHDERQAKADAQTALRDLALPQFSQSDEFTYSSFRKYDSFDHFAKKFINKHCIPGDDSSQTQIQAAKNLFEQYGAPDYRFKIAKRVMHLSEKT